MTFFNRSKQAHVGATVRLTDGRIGIIDSIGQSPFYGDNSQAAYVVGEGFAVYVAI